MDFNNYNFFNPNMDPYFTPISFNLDNFNPDMYNMNQQYMPSWDYPTHYDLISNPITKIFKIISTFHRVNGLSLIHI